MKVQHIAVIFIIIILPVSMIMFSVVDAQIDTINLQSNYNSKLTESTYSAVKAFQINTVNNRYSSVSNSKIRDIEAAISTFYNALSSNELLTQQELRDFVPALVFTLYDGYYIYSKYDNVYPENNGQVITDEQVRTGDYINYGLKPYIYYSCHYRNNSGNKDFVVNFTLDNAITIYGTFGTEGYKTLSGYLINYNDVQIKSYNANNPQDWKLTYNGVEIGPEVLTEHVLFVDNSEKDYDYLEYNGQKIYYDPQGKMENGETKYFRYQNYSKVYITDSYANTELLTYLKARTGEGGKFGNDGHLHSTSAFEYYYTAREFSMKVKDLTSGVTPKDAKDENGNALELNLSDDTMEKEIFVPSASNDPLLSGSNFNETRVAVIRKSIETNLNVAIANYKMYSDNNYEFALPELAESDWDKITNKVSMISFLQGLPIGYKYFNNYCVVSNDSNEETINKENIYIITENTVSR